MPLAARSLRAVAHIATTDNTRSCRRTLSVSDDDSWHHRSSTWMSDASPRSRLRGEFALAHTFVLRPGVDIIEHGIERKLQLWPNRP